MRGIRILIVFCEGKWRVHSKDQTRVAKGSVQESGVAANENSVEALASGNAALSLLASNPYVDADTLTGLIIALG